MGHFVVTYLHMGICMQWSELRTCFAEQGHVHERR